MKVSPRPFALNQDNNFTFFLYCVIYFFTLFCSNISREFRNNFSWIKGIITKSTYKWHDKSIL